VGNHYIFNAEHLATEQMQKIAAEINFAESTFVTR
jgi:predicted PhzF superfamily epimerase YddE/YHI9